MKSTKQLEQVFKEAKGKELYYSFEDFKRDAHAFIKDVKSRKIIFGLKVSSSGMTRRFNTLNYNMLLNICYNGKFSYEAVKVTGCGMDMAFSLLYNTVRDLMTEREASTLNSLCSSYAIL